VDFPLSRWPGRGGGATSGVPAADAGSVHAARQRLSLLAVLRYVYERAGLNRWYPAMHGVRNQGVLHKYLLGAADEIQVKGERLSERLYVPEPWRAEAMAEIAERRRRKLAMLQRPGEDGRFNMALVIGEHKAHEPAPGGHKLVIKHMPDAPLLLDVRAWGRAERKHGGLLQALDADAERKPRLLLAALVYAAREQVYQVDTLALMLASYEYLPLDGVHELPLIERLVGEQRAFLKPLRYGVRDAALLPTALLLDSLDAAGRPLPLYVISAFAPREQRAALAACAAASAGSWVWHTERDMPALPACTVQRARRPAAASAWMGA
jgi:hypothetical protein